MLKNINLEGVNMFEQIEKCKEEKEEYKEALREKDKSHIIEEFWDCIQAEVGFLSFIGISADMLNEGYKKHLEKMESRGYRPRVKTKWEGKIEELNDRREETDKETFETVMRAYKILRDEELSKEGK